MELGNIIRLVILIVIIIVLVILFVVLGLKKKKIPPEEAVMYEEELEKSIETEVEAQPEAEVPPDIDPPMPPENCEGPLKEVISPFPKPPEPLDPSQSECMELEHQNRIIHDMLDWGPDDHPQPTYYQDKFCQK